jgi:hypothetical protein
MNTMSLVAITVACNVTAPLTDSDVRIEDTDSVWVLVDASAAAEDDDDRKDLLREAETLAYAALTDHEDDIERRYLVAVVLGLRANVEGGRTKVRVAAALSEQLEAILAADPDHAGARHMLGRLHAGVRRMSRITRWVATNVLGGDELKKATWEAAEENLFFAEQQSPEISDHHLQLALLYRDTGRPEMAAAEITHVMELQASTAMELAVQREAMEVWTDIQP